MLYKPSCQALPQLLVYFWEKKHTDATENKLVPLKKYYIPNYVKMILPT